MPLTVAPVAAGAPWQSIDLEGALLHVLDLAAARTVNPNDLGELKAFLLAVAVPASMETASAFRRPERSATCPASASSIPPEAQASKPSMTGPSVKGPSHP